MKIGIQCTFRYAYLSIQTKELTLKLLKSRKTDTKCKKDCIFIECYRDITFLPPGKNVAIVYRAS